MARITVEDCENLVGNKFDLVRVASKRARQLNNGYEPKVDEEGDKCTVLALREISEGKVKADILTDPISVNSGEVNSGEGSTEAEQIQVSFEDEIKKMIQDAVKADEENNLLNKDAEENKTVRKKKVSLVDEARKDAPEIVSTADPSSLDTDGE